jgi:hypothetical protein
MPAHKARDRLINVDHPAEAGLRSLDGYDQLGLALKVDSEALSVTFLKFLARDISIC